MTEYYKQTIEGFDLSLERGTDTVPKDGKFYILYKKSIVFSSKSLPETRKRFKQILLELGYNPKKRKKLKDINVKNFIEKERESTFFHYYYKFWDRSHKFKKGGR